MHECHVVVLPNTPDTVHWPNSLLRAASRRSALVELLRWGKAVAVMLAALLVGLAPNVLFVLLESGAIPIYQNLAVLVFGWLVRPGPRLHCTLTAPLEFLVIAS